MMNFGIERFFQHQLADRKLLLSGAVDTQDEVQIKHIRRAYTSSCLELRKNPVGLPTTLNEGVNGPQRTFKDHRLHNLLMFAAFTVCSLPLGALIALRL